MPYITRPKPNTPAGVVRSPSCLSSLMPCWPTQAVHGPAASSQHAPDFRQSRSSACVADRRGGTTVTSCVAEPIDVSPFGSADGHAALCARPTVAETAAQSNAQDQSAIVLGIGGQRTRERRRSVGSSGGRRQLGLLRALDHRARDDVERSGPCGLVLRLPGIAG